MFTCAHDWRVIRHRLQRGEPVPAGAWNRLLARRSVEFLYTAPVAFALKTAKLLIANDFFNLVRPLLMRRQREFFHLALGPSLSWAAAQFQT